MTDLHCSPLATIRWRGRAEEEPAGRPGPDRVIWLQGDPLDAETDGHIDGMCCFVRPGVVMFEYNPDPNNSAKKCLSLESALESATRIWLSGCYIVAGR